MSPQKKKIVTDSNLYFSVAVALAPYIHIFKYVTCNRCNLSKIEKAFKFDRLHRLRGDMPLFMRVLRLSSGYDAVTSGYIRY